MMGQPVWLMGLVWHDPSGQKYVSGRSAAWKRGGGMIGSRRMCREQCASNSERRTERSPHIGQQAYASSVGGRWRVCIHWGYIEESGWTLGSRLHSADLNKEQLYGKAAGSIVKRLVWVGTPICCMFKTVCGIHIGTSEKLKIAEKSQEKSFFNAFDMQNKQNEQI